jgi:putative acetyltransferase
MKIRQIEQNDNASLAKLIRTVFEEFDLEKEGTVYSDATTDALYSVFLIPKSVYWVSVDNGIVTGGCGIVATDGLPLDCVEIVKFYVSSQARGKGIGKALLQKSIASAREFGYKQLYLESFPKFHTAINMYEKLGFRKIDKALGCSGHFACSVWMVMDL